MKKTVALLAAFGISALQSSEVGAEAVNFDTGNGVYAACTGDDAAQLQCLAFINGFNAGQEAAMLETARRASMRVDGLRHYCIAPEVTQGQAMDVVVNFLRQAAAIRHLPSNALIELAFERAFPCRAITKQTAK